MIKHYLNYFESAAKQYWNQPALTNYGKETLTFSDIATRIEKFHLLFQLVDIKKGEKITLCAKNSAQWAVAFLATTTYDAVVVPLLNDFLPESVQHLTNHSDSVVLFTETAIWEKMDIQQMPGIRLAINIQDSSVLYLKEEFGSATALLERANVLFKERFPNGVTPEAISYPTGNLDELEIINYTSGTTSDPKGVMLSARNISSNIDFAISHMPNKPGWTMLSMLPLAHLYGMAFEFIYPLVTGCQIFFLGKTPTPSILIKGLSEVKPYMLITVPLVVEKIFKSKVFPTLEKPLMKVLMSLPGINNLILRSIRKKLIATFGGHLEDGLVVGGAAINEKVERLMKKMHFPYTVGYGMTECGPLICFENWYNFAMRSCGKKVERMEIRILSDDPCTKVGEIQVKGENVMLGYYKNPEATKATFTDDGWMRTGDLGLFDKEGNLYIKGRSKNMILGGNGQNIYPEEIEDKLNSLPLVMESIVVSRSKKLVALVVPDMDAFNKLENNTRKIENIMEEYLDQVNQELPVYSKLNRIELRNEPFEKTPKRSIKRFLYS